MSSIITSVENMQTICSELCMSIKNKNEYVQCKNRKKNNTDYCGIHIKSKNIIRIDTYLNKVEEKNDTVEHALNYLSSIDIPFDNTKYAFDFYDHKYDDAFDKLHQVNNVNIKTIDNAKSVKIYSKNDIFNESIDLKINVLRNTAKDIKLIIDIRDKKKDIIAKLRTYYISNEKYNENIHCIILIQSYVRKFLVLNRKKCVNSTDFSTLQPLIQIPNKYYINLNDKDGYKYGFDIRSINQLYNQSNDQLEKNPYNRTDFPVSFIKSFKTKITLLSKKGIDITFDSENSSDASIDENVEFELKVLSVFQKFNELDNYTDHKWFLELSYYLLQKLYMGAKDMWEYRCEIPYSDKIKIVGGEVVFSKNLQYIYSIPNNDNGLKILRNIIIDEFDKFVSNGATRDNKKVGAMLMLTSLVEVSEKAANAMPLYVQNL